MIVEAESGDREPTLRGAPLGLPSDQDASGRSFGAAELDRLRAVIESGTLTATKGAQTPELEARIATLTGRRARGRVQLGHRGDPRGGRRRSIPSRATRSSPPPSPTWARSTPILYQGAIPVFADVDPDHGHGHRRDRRGRAVTPDACGRGHAPVRAARTGRRHRGGRRRRGRAAASRTARRRTSPSAPGGRSARSGRSPASRTQQGKHLATGEGGLVVTDDDAVARRARVFVNKGWPYGESDPDHEFLALNLRTTELAGGRGQRAARHAARPRSRTGSATVGAVPRRDRRRARASPRPTVAPGDVATWWKVPLLVDPGGRRRRAARARRAPRGARRRECAALHPEAGLRLPGVPRAAHVRHEPVAVPARPRPRPSTTSPARFPGTYAYLDRVLVLPWNERYEDADADAVAAALADALTRAWGWRRDACGSASSAPATSRRPTSSCSTTWPTRRSSAVADARPQVGRGRAPPRVGAAPHATVDALLDGGAARRDRRVHAAGHPSRHRARRDRAAGRGPVREAARDADRSGPDDDGRGDRPPGSRSRWRRSSGSSTTSCARSELVAAGALGELIQIENRFASRVDMRAPVELRSRDQRRRRAHRQRHPLGRHRPVVPRPDPRGARRRGTEGPGRSTVEDSVQVLLRAASGATATIDLSWSYDHATDAYLELYGSEGVLRVGWHGSELRANDADRVDAHRRGLRQDHLHAGPGRQLLRGVARRGADARSPTPMRSRRCRSSTRATGR